MLQGLNSLLLSPSLASVDLLRCASASIRFFFFFVDCQCASLSLSMQSLHLRPPVSFSIKSRSLIKPKLAATSSSSSKQQLQHSAASRQPNRVLSSAAQGNLVQGIN